MATTPQQGIMALPETDEATAPQLPLNESYSAAKQGLTEANPEFTAMYDDAMSKAMPALMALTDEQLDAMLQLVQYLQESPEEYSQRLKELEQEGVIDKGDFPEQYDENFLAVFGAAVLEAQRTNEDTGTATPAMQPPMQLAKGGIAEAARMVAKQGRSGDTMLAHITKDEAALLKKHGGIGTLNPRTGLQEYGLKSFVKGVVSTITAPVKAVASAVKTVLASPIGKIAATVALAAFIGPYAAAYMGTGTAGAAALTMAGASAGVTALSGGNIKDIIKSGVTGAITGYAGAALGPALNMAPGAASAAVGAGATSAGMSLLQGKSIKQSLTEGLTAAAVAGAMTYGQNGSDVPVRDATGKPVPVDTAGKPLTPGTAGDVSNVNANTGQVGSGTAPAAITPQASANVTQPLASSNAAFDQALNNYQPINGLTADSGMTVTGNVAPPVAPVAPPVAPVSSADPMGDFIQQNEALRAAANTPAPKPEPTMWDSIKQGYKEYLSPSGRQQIGAAEAQKAGLDAVANVRADAAARNITLTPQMEQQVFADAVKANTPGIISNYGPAVGATMLAAGALGGFKQEQPETPQATKDVYTGKASADIIKGDPTKYLTQGLPGVSYDASGNITGSTSWTPRSGAETTQVAGKYIGYNPSQQVAAPLPNFQPIASQTTVPNYSTAPQQYNFVPRYAAQGGMMETAGAFPANPLTMSNPAMAMGAHQLPMNTPGVPMNLPMGYADGGIASIAKTAKAIAGFGDSETSPLMEQAAPPAEPWSTSKGFSLAELVSAMQNSTSANQKEANARLAAYYARQRAEGKPVSNEKAGIASLAVGGMAPRYYGDGGYTSSANEATTPYTGQAGAMSGPFADILSAVIPAVQQATQVRQNPQNIQALAALQENAMANQKEANARLAAYYARQRAAGQPVGNEQAGIASLAVGGYPRRTGQISGPGTETSDDIPAMLSDGEFVMTAKAVKGAGGGSRRAGAKKMYALMHRLEKNAARG